MAWVIYLSIMVQIIVAVLLFFFLPISQGASSPQKVVVESSLGPFLGTVEESQNGGKYAQFLGIPYADPPIGKLRFSKPVPVSQEKWNKPKDATKLPPICAQKNLSRKKESESDFIIGQEDCLVLNIYKPGLKMNNCQLLNTL